MDTDEVYTIREAAAYLHVHRQTVRRHVGNGHLPATLEFGRYFLPRRAVQEFANHYDPRPGRPAAKRHRRRLAAALREIVRKSVEQNRMPPDVAERLLEEVRKLEED
jgi:excisionase family DNA binding protein